MQRPLRALLIFNAKRRPTVVAEVKFREIPVKVLLADLVEGAADRAADALAVAVDDAVSLVLGRKRGIPCCSPNLNRT